MPQEDSKICKFCCYLFIIMPFPDFISSEKQQQQQKKHTGQYFIYESEWGSRLLLAKKHN